MVVLLTLLLQAQAIETQPAVPPPLPVSLERIRRGLEERTDRLDPPAPTSTPRYRVHVLGMAPPPERVWEERTLTPAFVRPTRDLYQHELLAQVTPDLFKSTSMHPCCPVLPAVEFVVDQVKGMVRSYQQKRARREVQNALREFLKQQEQRR